MSFPSRTQLRFVIKPIWFVACLIPFAWMALSALELIGDGLGPDPIEYTQDFMGIWALRFLLLTLALTPLRKLTGKVWFVQLRRMTGLFALFYASLHLLNYLVPDQGLNGGAILEDILERQFITLGALAVLGLLLLGVTSTRGWQQRLGRRWKQLHKLVYGIAILVVWHFWWQVKADITEPLIYAIILATLLSYRVYLAQRSRAKKKPRPEYPNAAQQ